MPHQVGDTIMVDVRELQRMEAERDALRQALEAVEFGREHDCPWCGEWEEHAPDCQRQAALGLREERE